MHEFEMNSTCTFRKRIWVQFYDTKICHIRKAHMLRNQIKINCDYFLFVFSEDILDPRSLLHVCRGDC